MVWIRSIVRFISYISGIMFNLFFFAAQLMKVLQLAKDLLRTRARGENKEAGPLVPLLETLIRSRLSKYIELRLDSAY